MPSGWHRRAGPATGWSDDDERRARAGRGVRAAGGRAAPGRRLVPVGPVPERAPVGHGAGGLQRRRRRLGLPPARSRPVPRLPVGGGRHGRLLRRGAAALPGPGAVERTRPDPQGADVRPDRGAGQPRGGRQGVLVVPGRRPQPRLEPLALPLPAGRLPLRRPARRQRAAGQARSGVRAARHRRVRRGPVLDRRGRLRQGRPHRPAHGGPGDQRRPRGGHAARAPDRLVPQHLVLGAGRAQAPAAGPGRTASVAIDHPFLGDLELLAGAGPDGVAPTAAVLRERDQQPATVRRARPDPVPQGRDQRPRRGWGGDRQPGPARHQGGAAGTGSTVGPAATVELRLRLRPDGAEPAGGGGARRRLRPGRGPAPAGGRRVLRRADPARPPGRRGDGHAAGVRRDAVEQAAVRLRRGPLAGGRPDPADPAGVPRWRAQRPLGHLRRLRRHVDAGQVGVPLVRRLGPGLPLRRPRPSRPGVRQVPAAAAVPGVVPAPQRGPARPTSGTSATSTRPCRPGRRSRCSPSTAPATSTSSAGCSTSCW